MTVQRKARRWVLVRRIRRRLVDAEGPAVTGVSSEEAGSPRYRTAGPALKLEGSERNLAARSITASRGPESEPATFAGTGEPASAVPGHANSVRLEGRTDADFNGGAFRTVGGRTRPATGCDACGADACQRATGRLVITFAVRTTVTLPTPDPSLTPCQLARVRNAIRTVLAPHEQQHVRAFKTYEGTVTKPFDLTLCHDDFDAAIQRMAEAEEGPRKTAAQAASDALDTPPFFFDVDLDCEDPTPPPRRPAPRASATAPVATGHER
jgi:hypothetical protein